MQGVFAAMIDLTKAKDQIRALKNALEPNINQKGTYILYHQGDFGDEVGKTPLGRAVYDMSTQGKVHLVQKITQQEPRQYNYYAVVR